MKKNKLLIISASCALGLSLVGMGVGAILSEDTAPETSTILDDSLGDDAIGHKVKLGVAASESDVTPEIESKIGVLAVDGEIAGTKDVRVYFRLTSVNGIQTASLTRSVQTEGGEVVKEATTLDVDYVYSSLKGAENATWLDMGTDDPTVIASDELAAAPYYLVYTLKNIPEAHWFDHVNVLAKLNGTEASPSKDFTYNVYGAIGDTSKGVAFESRPDREGEYYVKGTGGSEAVVPTYHCEYNGAIATSLGKVTCIGDPSTNYGGFEGKSSLESLTLPDSIDTFNCYSFSGASSLRSLTLPRDLNQVMSNSFNRMEALTTIEYEAVNLTTVEDTFENEGLTVNVSDDVESLPDQLIDNGAALVNYEGTTAEWEALKTETNQNNGLFIDNVICSDTITHTVTFHLGEGAIGDLTGDLDYTVIDGKLAQDPGDALLSGMAFKGWFLDETGETPWNPETPVTADLDVYAVYEEFGAGASASNPIILSTGATYTENLVPGYEKVYLTYTHPADAAADWRYLYVDESACEENEASTVTADNLDVEIAVHKGSFDAAAETIGSNDYVSKSTVKPLGVDGDVRFLAEPGQTYCFVIDPYSNDYYEDRVYYGSLVMKFLDFDHDSIESAGQLVYGETATVRRDDYTSSVQSPSTVFGYTPTETKSIALNIGRTNDTWAEVEVFDITNVENPTTITSDRSDSDSTVILNLEATHHYVFVVDLNGATSDTDYVTLKLDAIPAGADISNPIAMNIGEEITVESINSQYSFYSFTLEEAADLAFTLDGGSSSYAKYFKVYDNTGEQVATATETGVSSGYYGDTTYGGELLERLHLEAGSYVVEVGYSSSLYSYTSFTFRTDTVQDGDYIGRPATANLAEGNNTLNSTVGGYYYSYVPTTETSGKYLVIKLPDTDGLALDIVDAKDEVIKTAAAGGEVGVKLTEGENVLFVLRGVDSEAVAIETSFVDTYQDGLAEDTAYTLDRAGIFATSDGGDASIFTFSVEETGDYVFYSNTPRDLDLSRIYTLEDGNVDYDGYNDDNGRHEQTGNDDDFAAEVHLVAGTVYYARITGYGQTAGMTAEQFTIGLSKITPGSLLSAPMDSEFLGKDSVSLDGGETATYYRDTMDQDGWYTLKVDEASTGTLTVYDGTKVAATLTGGDSYFLEAKTSETVTVKVEGSVTFSSVYSTTVQNGSSRANAVELPSDGRLPYTYTGSKQDSYWIKFTVPSDGEYVFYSETNNASAVYAFDPRVKNIYEGDSTTALASGEHDDPYGEHGNKYDSHVIVELKAGVTYYAEVIMPGPYNSYAVEYILEPVATAAA